MSNSLHEMYQEDEVWRNVSDGTEHSKFGGGKQFTKQEKELLKRKLAGPEKDIRLQQRTRQTDEFGRVLTRESIREEEPRSKIGRIRKKLDKTAYVKGKTGHETFKNKNKKRKLIRSSKPLSLNPFAEEEKRMKIKEKMKNGLREAKRHDRDLGKGERWEREGVSAFDLESAEKEYRKGVNTKTIKNQINNLNERKRKIQEIESDGWGGHQSFSSAKKRKIDQGSTEKTELTHDDSHFNAIFATPAQTLHLLEEKQKLKEERILKEKEEKDKNEFKKSVVNPKFLSGIKKKKGSWRDRMKNKKS